MTLAKEDITQFLWAVTAILLFGPVISHAKEGDLARRLRRQAEKEIQLPSSAVSREKQTLATVSAKLPVVENPPSAQGSFSLLLSSQDLDGRSRYVDDRQLDLQELSPAVLVGLQLERDFAQTPLPLWFSIFYSSQSSLQESPLGEADPIQLTTLAMELGPGYRFRLSSFSALNLRLSYGQFWLMQNSNSGLAEQSLRIPYVSAQIQWEFSGLWGSSWHPFVSLQKRWALAVSDVGVADPRGFVGLMYRGL